MAEIDSLYDEELPEFKNGTLSRELSISALVAIY